MSHLLILIAGAIVICLGLIFFFSGAETAIISANKFRLRSLHEQGDATAGKLLELLGNTQRLLVMVLIGSNIIGVILALSFAQLIDRLLPRLAERPALWLVTWGDVLDLVLLTPLVVVFAEILPKALFRSRADRMIGRIRPVILLFLVLLKPLILIVERFTSLVLSPLSEQRSRVMRQLTRQDVINLISPEEKEDEGGEEGHEGRPAPAPPSEALGRTIARQAQVELDRLAESTDERRMIHNIIELQETRASEIMTPLVDLVAVQLGRMDLNGFRQLARSSGYSRFPVYREKITNLIGYIDVFRVLRECDSDGRRLEEFIERPHYVPATKRVDDLLQEFLRLRVKNAIVVDEYGGSAGWISREDMLEEIVGELEDELDEPSRQITETAEGVYLVEGRMEIDALNHVLEADFSDEEWETLAGLILNEMGRIPGVGDEVVIGPWHATVAAMTGNRIDKVRLARVKE